MYSQTFQTLCLIELFLGVYESVMDHGSARAGTQRDKVQDIIDLKVIYEVTQCLRKLSTWTHLQFFFLYSILNHIDLFRTPGSPFELRITWPDSGITGRNIWYQDSNPTTAPVEGYEPIEIDYTNQFWGGLELSTNNSTYLDGSVQHQNWFYSIGSQVAWQEGIPSHGPPSNRVALWIGRASSGAAEPVLACAPPPGLLYLACGVLEFHNLSTKKCLWKKDKN